MSPPQDSLTILSDIEQIRPRMLLIDIMMPGINGMEVTKQIRKKLQFQDLPILLVSANHYVTSAQAKQSGADDILYKPFNLDDLLSRVEMLLSQSTQKSAKMSEKKSQKNDNSYFQLLKSH